MSVEQVIIGTAGVAAAASQTGQDRGGKRPNRPPGPRYPTCRYKEQHAGMSRAERREWRREQRGTAFWSRTVRPVKARPSVAQRRAQRQREMRRTA